MTEANKALVEVGHPDVEKFVKRFEREKRPVYRERGKIIKALHLKKGMSVADIGAGTGFMSLLLAEELPWFSAAVPLTRPY